MICQKLGKQVLDDAAKDDPGIQNKEKNSIKFFAIKAL